MNNIFGKKLKELREECGISLMQLAKSIDVSDAAICKWENGLAEPRLSYVIKLAAFFDCSVEFLISDGGPTPSRQCSVGCVDGGERELIKLYKKLPQDKKELLLSLARSWN